MYRQVRLPARWLWLIFLAAPLCGSPQARLANPPANRAEQQVVHITGRVATLTGEPVKGAEVNVQIDAQPEPPVSTETNLKGTFEAECPLRAASRKAHLVKVTASKDGYLDSMETVDLKPGSTALKVNLIQRESVESADQLPLATLVSSLLPGLRTSVGNGSSQAPELSDSVLAGAKLLGKNDPADATSFLATLVERRPSCVECRILLGLALLGRGSWASALPQFAQADVLEEPRKVEGKPPAEAQPRRFEPFFILGVIENWRNRPKRAERFFLQSLEVDSRNPLALEELGRAYLLEGNEEAADKYLAMAVKAGAPAEAHFLRARALLAENNPKEAEAEMQVYLGDRLPKQLPGPIRGLWNLMMDRLQVESSGNAKSVVQLPLADLIKAVPELKGIEPAQSQEQLNSILRQVGEGLEAFFRGFPNTSSIEKVREERLRPNGKVGQSFDQEFEYLCLAPPERAMPGFVEYRTNAQGEHTAPAGLDLGFMLTAGFTSASLPFHPSYQPESRFRYVGKQVIDGHQAFVIAFAQRPERARLMGAFRVNQLSLATLTQGLAWVDSKTYQILRMRTDLLNPLSQVKLDRETTEIRFGQVHFKEISAELWLPHEVIVTVDWNGRTLRNTHSYSEFKLFHVQTTEKRKARVLIDANEN